ncbi:MAG TPA: hypothetical protein VFH73_19885 [Polyangia bacterium]|jgi:hypothetical protein|nr:hypothetical protein [Polyangia bacterium]
MIRTTLFAPLLLVAVAVAVSVTFLGCGNFEDVTTVIDLRTVAIKAAKPEIQIDLNQPDAPYSATLTALVMDPAGAGRPVSYEVIACPRELDTVTAATGRAGAICKPYDPNSAEVDRSVPVTAAGGPAMTAPGAGPEHQIVLPDFAFPRDLLERALMLDPFAALGFPSAIIFQLTISAGAESETAIKRVVFSIPPAGHPDQPPNANPEITQVVSYRERDAAGMPIDEQPLPPADPTMPEPPPVLMVPLGRSVWIEPRGAAAESYYTPVLTRGSMPSIIVEQIPRETLRFAFFASAGKFAPPTTSTEPLPIFGPTERIHLESRYTAPAVMPENPQVTFWIVARDERGGTSWSRRTLLLVNPP